MRVRKLKLNWHPVESYWKWVNTPNTAIEIEKAGATRYMIPYGDKFIERDIFGKYVDQSTSKHIHSWRVGHRYFNDCIITKARLENAGWVFGEEVEVFGFKSCLRALLGVTDDVQVPECSISEDGEGKSNV